MSQISDYVDNAGVNATDDRVLGFAVVATSKGVHASALAALEAGQTAQDAVRLALAEGAVFTWTPPDDVAAEASLIETSYRGYIVFTPDSDSGRALLATLRLADELPFSSTDEAAFESSLEACADVCIRDVRAGADLDVLLGADVETRIARMQTPTSPRPAMQTEGDAVIVIDRAGNVAIATTGPIPFIVDRSGMPWLAGAVRGESVLAPASFLHAVIDRAEALEQAVTRAAGLILAAISHELYRDAFVDAALPDALARAERGDPPPKAPMPARGQNFTIGPAGHDG